MIRQDTLEITPILAQTPEGTQCVLLVEDDPALRRYLEVVLQRAGYVVMTAGDGLEAMKVLLTLQVDVIVTDALMLRKAKRSPRAPADHPTQCSRSEELD
jgi:PleD family two-component response regulator